VGVGRHLSPGSDARYHRRVEPELRGVVILPRQSTPTPVSLVVTATEVRATAPNGETLALPLASLEVTPGGYDGDFVFLRAAGHEATFSTTDLAVVERLASVGGPAMEARLASVRKHRGSAALWRKVSLVVAATIAATLVGLTLLTPMLLSWSIDLLPAELDREIGDGAAADLESEGPIVSDPRVVGLIESIVVRLRESGPPSVHEYRVSVIENDDVNAFALPGGRIVVWTGLIEEAESAEQIAGVLAHEMAHVERRHGLRNVTHQAGLAIGLRVLLAVVLGVDLDGFTGLAADVAVLAVANEYSQSQESQADADAVVRMYAAGIDPLSLASFFRLMEREEVGGVPAFASWLSTHPDHESRISAIEAHTRSLPALAPRSLGVDLAAAQAALE